MSTITSNIGLASGLPIADIVDGLIAVQRRPITLIENRIAALTALRTALMDVSARLLGLKTAAGRLKDEAVFRATVATSSNDQVVRAVAGAGAAVGSFTFSVRQLASTQQFVSGGYASADSAWLSPGTLVFDSALARVDRSTALGALRGGLGVGGGVIRITDRAGASADIDLTAARRIEDVVFAINSQTDADVRARVQGDRLILEDQTGLNTGELVVVDLGSGRAAADLGIAGSAASGVITGADVVSLAAGVRLEDLNDRNGIRRGAGGPDFRIELADGSALDVDLSGNLSSSTALAQLNGGAGVAAGSIQITNRAGQSATVNLSAAQTIGDVVAAINAAGVGVTALAVGNRLQLTDASGGSGTLSVAESGGGTTASDLGLLGSTDTAILNGRAVLHIATLGDVLNAINLHAQNGGRVAAAISADGDALQLTDRTSGPADFAVVVLNDSKAAADLGLLRPPGGDGTIRSGRLLSGLETVLLRSLNGGTGVEAGVIRITTRDGGSTDIDLTGASTLAEVIDAINVSGLEVAARVSDSGLGIVVQDQSGGSGALVIEDVSGTAAAALGIAFNGAASMVVSGNLQMQYLSDATRLETLNGGQGIARGQFRITNAAGQSAVVDLTQGNERTLGDVIAEINSRGIDVTARINDTGDGLLIEDHSVGGGQLSITDEGAGTTARSLGIAGTAASGAAFIDGSFETRITVTASDTLSSVLGKIQSSRAAVSATLLNDGSGASPYRLAITAARSGVVGRVAIDGGSTGLTFATLARGRDAVLQMGGAAEGDVPLTITSSTNSIQNVLPGVTLELVGASTQPVTVTVDEDVDAIVTALSAFKDAFNDVLSRIDALSTFDAEQETRGILLGDRSAEAVRARLARFVTHAVAGQPAGIARLSGVGFSFSGGQLSFDETKFRSALEEQPDAVERLFADDEDGLGQVLEDLVNDLTESGDGLLPRRDETLSQTEAGLAQRKAELEALLDSRRQRLLAQFQAMETVIARLQSQQSAVASLSSALGLLAGQRRT